MTVSEGHSADNFLYFILALLWLASGQPHLPYRERVVEVLGRVAREESSRSMEMRTFPWFLSLVDSKVYEECESSLHYDTLYGEIDTFSLCPGWGFESRKHSYPVLHLKTLSIGTQPP